MSQSSTSHSGENKSDEPTLDSSLRLVRFGFIKTSEQIDKEHEHVLGSFQESHLYAQSAVDDPVNDPKGGHSTNTSPKIMRPTVSDVSAIKFRKAGILFENDDEEIPDKPDKPRKAVKLNPKLIRSDEKHYDKNIQQGRTNIKITFPDKIQGTEILNEVPERTSSLETNGKEIKLMLENIHKDILEIKQKMDVLFDKLERSE